MMLRTTLLWLALLLSPYVYAQSVVPARERQFPLGLVDANGKPMGPYLQADAMSGIAIIKVNGTTVPLTVGPLYDSSGTWFDLSRLVPLHGGAAYTWFDAPSCQGNAYIQPDGMLVGFTPATVHGDLYGRGTMYIALNGPPTQVVVYSRLAQLSDCINETPLTVVGYRTLPAIDLATLFKAPYSVK